jgi:hypothetical protein
MKTRGFTVVALLALASGCGRITFAQDKPTTSDAIPLTVRAGLVVAQNDVVADDIAKRGARKDVRWEMG